MKTLLHYWPMLLSGTALAAGDPAGIDTSGTTPPKARETIVVRVSGSNRNCPISRAHHRHHRRGSGTPDRHRAHRRVQERTRRLGDRLAGRPQNISIRGIGGNRVLIIKDGVRVSDGFGADDLNDKVGRFSFDLDDVKQIEVARGPAPPCTARTPSAAPWSSPPSSQKITCRGRMPTSSKVLHDGSSDKQKLSATGAARWGESAHLLRLSGWQGHETANYDQSRIPADLDGLSASTSSSLTLNEQHLLRLELDYFEDNAKRDQGPREIPQPDGKWQVRQYRENGTQRPRAAS